ncbi:MAG TPA: YcxB family protein [Terriglobia bacterium]|nr:YcxB family protein [Terriglobia bacterium]
MDSTVSLLFRYSKQDIVRAMRLHYSSRLRLRFDITVTALSAAMGFYFWQATNSRFWGITSLGVSGIFALVLIAAFTIIPPLSFRRNPKYRDDYELTFSPDGIHFRTAHIDSQLQWNLYSRAFIDSHSFVLYSGDDYFTVIPKRVFESGEQLRAFELLLSQKVQKIVKKGRETR